MNQPSLISEKDRKILRELARRTAEIAAHPSQREKARRWTLHNDLQTSEPLVFIDPENGWREIIAPQQLSCEGELARGWEFGLRRTIHQFEALKDDRVIDDFFTVPYVSRDTGWGVPVRRVGGENGGAYHVLPAICEYEADFPKLHFPQLEVDIEASARLLEQALEVFGDILRVRQQSAWWWSLGLTWRYIDLRGLEEFLCDFLLEPQWVHRMMDFLCQGTLDMLDQLERGGLLSLNTENSYVGSGGLGYTSSLPAALDRPASTRDLWGFVESQETAPVSPQMYGEFIYPYHEKIARRFGLNCFGCCEPYEGRWAYARKLPRLRRVSCSPWSDRTRTEDLLGMSFVASHKLSPTPLSMPNMDEDEVRKEIRSALIHSKNCVPELVMKDNHTLGNNPRNAARWVEIAREEIARL